MGAAHPGALAQRRLIRPGSYLGQLVGARRARLRKSGCLRPALVRLFQRRQSMPVHVARVCCSQARARSKGLVGALPYEAAQRRLSRAGTVVASWVSGGASALEGTLRVLPVTGAGA